MKLSPVSSYFCWWDNNGKKGIHPCIFFLSLPLLTFPSSFIHLFLSCQICSVNIWEKRQMKKWSGFYRNQHKQKNLFKIFIFDENFFFQQKTFSLNNFPLDFNLSRHEKSEITVQHYQSHLIWIIRSVNTFFCFLINFCITSRERATERRE